MDKKGNSNLVIRVFFYYNYSVQQSVPPTLFAGYAGGGVGERQFHCVELFCVRESSRTHRTTTQRKKKKQGQQRKGNQQQQQIFF